MRNVVITLIAIAGLSALSGCAPKKRLKKPVKKAQTVATELVEVPCVVACPTPVPAPCPAPTPCGCR